MLAASRKRRSLGRAARKPLLVTMKTSYEEKQQLMDGMKTFSDLFIQNEAAGAPVFFDNFELAYTFGKNLAQRVGFSIRIKTSSYSTNRSTRYRLEIHFLLQHSSFPDSVVL